MYHHNYMNVKISKIVYFINFNQDNSCFCIGTDEGYEIYNCEPFKKIKKKNIPPYGIAYIAMLYRTNILALIKKNGLEDEKKEKNLILYDDQSDEITSQIEFNEKIREVFLRKSEIVVLLPKSIFIYDLVSMKLKKKIGLNNIQKALCSITYINNFKIAYSGYKIGEVNLHHFTNNQLKDEIKVIKAHKSKINKISLSNSGLLLATCSEKGTLVRIFNATDGDLLKELRRGSDETLINWIHFSFNDNLVLCQSKKGTIHIFNTHFHETSKKKNATFKLGAYFKDYLPKYFSSEWSFAHFHFPSIKTIAVFMNSNNSIFALNFKGNFYKINYNNKNYVTVIKNHY